MSDAATSPTLPWHLRLAARRFRGQRADYYLWLASLLEASRGRTTLLMVFERDAERFAGTPRGQLADWWANRFSRTSSLSQAWEGCLPQHEITIVRVAQEGSGDALLQALRDMARLARLADRVAGESLGTLMAGLVGSAVALAMLMLFPLHASERLAHLYGFIPLDQWGPRGQALMGHAASVQRWGAWALAVLAAGGLAIGWSIDHLTGRLRDWLDAHVLLYRALRDLRGALFMATLATLTRKRGNLMFTLRSSLATFAAAVDSPWLRWRIEQIMARMDRDGGSAESFDTPLLSREVFWFLRDTQEARGVAEGFEEAGRHVEQAVLSMVLRKLVVARWLLLGLSVAVVLFMTGWTFAVIHEMKSVMQAWYGTR
jgi:type II secretory pathway component PulF